MTPKAAEAQKKKGEKMVAIGEMLREVASLAPDLDTPIRECVSEASFAAIASDMA